jgi:protein phosphatase
MLDLEFAELSDPGLVREHNEDALGHVAPETPALVQSRGWLFALADGVGGQAEGEEASRLAIETVLDGFRKIPKGVMHVSLLPRLVQEANVAVYDRAHHGLAPGAEARGGGRMATTLVVCALRFDSAVISHVGDSRCYLLRQGSLSALTRDHTMAGEQERLGILSRAEANTGDNRHVLTRSLGTELFVAADTVTVNVIPGDVLVLATDGLHGYVTDERMEQILSLRKDLHETAKALVAEANKAGGHDNVSVQLIRVCSVERMGLYRGRPYRLL